MSNRSMEWISPTLTGAAGVAALAAALIFRDQLPVSKSVARVVGFGVLYGGVALFLWAAFHLKGALGGGVAPRLDQLVVVGPFRGVRHPVYLALTVAMIGVDIVTRSVAGLLITALVYLPLEIHRARLEERALEERFGDAWREYAARTGFFLPRRGRRSPT